MADYTDRQREIYQQLRNPSTKALILVDVQNDFCSNGALAVPKADEIIPFINRLRNTELYQWSVVILTQDWHPTNHASFGSNNNNAPLFTVIDIDGIGQQVMWPDHCVQNSKGAEFHPLLDRQASDIIVQKGKNPRVDSYSGFGDAKDHTLEKTELEDILRKYNVEDVFVCGLATDYCVAYTSKDAKRAGFNAYMVLDTSRGISEDSINKEIQAMKDLGVHVLESMNEVPTIVNETIFKNLHKLQENSESASANTSSSSSTV